MKGTDCSHQTEELVEHMEQEQLVHLGHMLMLFEHRVEDKQLKVAASILHLRVQNRAGHKEAPAAPERLNRMDTAVALVNLMDIDLVEGLDTWSQLAGALEEGRMMLRLTAAHTFLAVSSSAAVERTCWVRCSCVRSSTEQVAAANRVLDVHNHLELATDRSYSLWEQGSK